MIREGMIRAGVDYDSGVRRFAGKAQIYEKYLLKFFDKDPLLDLGGHLESGDYEAAFHSAHKLKGVSGNLSLGRMYDTICELTEFLRTGGQGERALLLYKRAVEFYREAEKAVKA